MKCQRFLVGRTWRRWVPAQRNSAEFKSSTEGAFGLPGPEPFDWLHVPVLEGKCLGREGREVQRV